MLDFCKWFSQFRESIADYRYYVEFEKVYCNVDNIRVELNILNSLIGSKSIEHDFKKIVERYPEVLSCIPILLAVRENEIYCRDENGEIKYDFNNFKPANNFEQYNYFLRETGLYELLENHIISNLVDYVTGIETGLDSNGRKNRGGHLMENLVEKYIQKQALLKIKLISRKCIFTKSLKIGMLTCSQFQITEKQRNVLTL